MGKARLPRSDRGPNLRTETSNALYLRAGPYEKREYAQPHFTRSAQDLEKPGG